MMLEGMEIEQKRRFSVNFMFTGGAVLQRRPPMR